jgi:hypothetical protein
VLRRSNKTSHAGQAAIARRAQIAIALDQQGEPAMHRPEDQESTKLMESLRGSLLWLCFGLSILAFLVATGHPEWFVLRPVSGTAAAMSHAGDSFQDERRAQTQAEKSPRAS